jgi:Flp pilus assembly protein TadG
MSGGRLRRDIDAGQALVEFALAIIVFLLLLMAIFDFGRGIYINNGLAQASREIARAASVDQGTSGYSVDAQRVIDTQKALVPGLIVDPPKCVLSTDTNATGSAGPCPQNQYIVVTTHATYTPVSLLGFLGTIPLQARSRIQIPLSQNK